MAHEQGFESIVFSLIGAGSGSFNQERAKTLDEYRKGKTIGDAITLSWLELFQEKGKTIGR